MALCELCCALFKARERWEETSIGRGQCMACGETVADDRQPFSVFRVDSHDLTLPESEEDQ